MSTSSGFVVELAVATEVGAPARSVAVALAAAFDTQEPAYELRSLLHRPIGQKRVASPELPSLYSQVIAPPGSDRKDAATTLMVSSESRSGSWFLRSVPCT